MIWFKHYIVNALWCDVTPGLLSTTLPCFLYILQVILFLSTRGGHWRPAGRILTQWGPQIIKNKTFCNFFLQTTRSRSPHFSVRMRSRLSVHRIQRQTHVSCLLRNYISHERFQLKSPLTTTTALNIMLVVQLNCFSVLCHHWMMMYVSSSQKIQITLSYPMSWCAQ